MKKPGRTFVIALAVFLVLVLAAAFILPRLRPYAFHGLVLQSPKPAADFTLTSQSGEPISLSDFRGKLVMLYFGYTFCPDVCPTSLSDAAKALDLLGPKKAEEVQFIMISVDPERDTPEQLAEYVAHFDPTFIGLTGSDEEIAAVATPFGIYYQKHEGTPATGYLVDHTASITVIDKEGRVRLVWPFETGAEAMAEDLAYMLKKGGVD